MFAFISALNFILSLIILFIVLSILKTFDNFSDMFFDVKNSVIRLNRRIGKVKR